MGKLIYGINISLDGYISDAKGDLGWGEPQEDLHRYINDLERNNSLNLFGRKMYEILAVWETWEMGDQFPEYMREYKDIWLEKDKIVFSRTLKEASTGKTTIRQEFIKSEIEELKRQTPGTIGIGGADLASQALDMGLVDEIVLFVYPVILGAGSKWISNKNLAQCELLETRLFQGGVLLVRYSPKH